MNMLQPTLALEHVREGHGYFMAAHNKRSHKENLRDYVNAGFIDQEKAHLAIIEGNRKRAKTALRIVHMGLEDLYNLGTGKTYKQELRELVNRGYIDQGDAHKAIIEGRKRGIK